MSPIVNLDRVEHRPKVCLAIGNFDGVHLGHQVLLERLRVRASQKECPAWVLTFEPHPQILIKGSQFKLLQTYSQKYETLLNMQIDGIFVANFNSTFRSQSPLEFLNHLYQTLDVHAIQVGYDFRFGLGGAGDTQLMKDFFQKINIEVEITHRQQIDGSAYSSGDLRQSILRGDTKFFEKAVSRNFTIRGQVIRGSQRGRTIGFPTANIHPPSEQIALKPGVYAVKCRLSKDILWGLANLGQAPTFDQQQHQLEVYFLDFSDNLYDKILDIEFIDRIRDIKRFDGPERLKTQIRADLAWFEEQILSHT